MNIEYQPTIFLMEMDKLKRIAWVDSSHNFYNNYTDSSKIHLF